MGDKKQDKVLPDTTMSLGDHLEELRRRLLLAIVGLVLAVILTFAFGTKIIAFIQWPYNHIEPDNPLQALAPADAFIGYMKVSLIAGLVISSPWVFYQLWMFVAAGLYPSERKYVKAAVPFSATLFVGGALFFLFVVAELSLKFFVVFAGLMNVRNNWTFQSYISFMTNLMLVFGIAFQTPIAIFVLNRMGLVSVAGLKSSRKFVFLAVFIIAAVVTPPDVISQVTLAVPLYGLFELGILLGWMAERKKSKADNR